MEFGCCHITLLLGLPFSFSAEVRIFALKTLLDEGAHSFTQAGVDAYRAVAYDAARNELIVGAKNHVFRLTKKLQKVEELELVPAAVDVQVCTFENHRLSECQVFINQICILGEDLFIFGISAFARPFYQRRSLTKFTANVIPQPIFDGGHMLPTNPHLPFARITVHEMLFIGTALDRDSDDIAILAMNLTDSTFQPVRTKKDGAWLVSPEFVGAFEEGQAVYFVFRELALEAESPSHDDMPPVYSRVGRVCKNDTGGRSAKMQGYFVSFTKARLVCEDYDVVTAVAYNTKQRMLYASFTDNDFKTVAVCLFEFHAIKTAFKGKYHYRENPEAKWRDVVAADSSTVKNAEYTCFGPRAIDEANDYHLLTEPIYPFCRKPHYKTTVGESDVFKAIAFSKVNDFEVYLADSRGNVWNFTVSGCSAKPFEVWEIETTPNASVHTVFVHDSIVVLTDTSVVSIPYDRVSRRKSDRLPSRTGPSHDKKERNDRHFFNKKHRHDSVASRNNHRDMKGAGTSMVSTPLSTFYIIPVYLMIPAN